MDYFTWVEILDSVTEIGKRAFHGNDLSSVEIGDGVIVDDTAIEGNFKEVYEDNNKSGGVYKRDNWIATTGIISSENYSIKKYSQTCLAPRFPVGGSYFYVP